MFIYVLKIHLKIYRYILTKNEKEGENLGDHRVKIWCFFMRCLFFSCNDI